MSQPEWNRMNRSTAMFWMQHLAMGIALWAVFCPTSPAQPVKDSSSGPLRVAVKAAGFTIGPLSAAGEGTNRLQIVAAPEDSTLMAISVAFGLAGIGLVHHD